jgi:anti-sigma B factor antagonist
MEKAVISQDGVVVIAPEGELDVSNSPELKEAIEQEIGNGRRKIVIDLQRVVYVDSSALGVLVSGLKEMRRQQGSLKLAHLTGSVAKIFQLTRLSRFFEVYESLDEALKSFGSTEEATGVVRS